MPKQAYAFPLQERPRIIYRNSAPVSSQIEFYFNDDAFENEGINKGDKKTFNIGFKYINDNRIYLVFVVSRNKYYPAHVHFSGNNTILSCPSRRFNDITEPNKNVQIRGVISNCKLHKI